MKNTISRIALLIFIVIIWLVPITSIQAKGWSDDFSEDEINQNARQENLDRTMNLVEAVKNYMKANDAYVGFLSRRGAGDPKTGVSDTDTLDLTGMAHTGFIVRNGFSKTSEYVTYNLVRQKGAEKVGTKEYDISDLRIWSLPHFFIGSFEKDAIVFLPEKKVQLQLWNLLRANGTLNIEKRKRYLKDQHGNDLLDDQGKPKFITDLIIKNGIFTLFHNPEYNLLSDYAEPSTQNCNEHLLKTYIGVRDFWQSGASYDLNAITPEQISALKNKIIKSIENNYIPGKMVLSRTKSTFAFVQNIRFGERYKESPSILGFKLKKEKFNVVSVDSFCNPKNQPFLKWADFKVLRESHNEKQGWYIEDKGRDFVKVNRFSGKKNAIQEM